MLQNQCTPILTLRNLSVTARSTAERGAMLLVRWSGHCLSGLAVLKIVVYKIKTNYTKLSSDTRKIKLAANCIFISTSTWYVHGPDDWKRVCWSSWKCTLDGPLEIWKLPSRIAFENNFHMHRLLGKNVTSQGWRHDNLHVSKLKKTTPVLLTRNKMRK